MLFRVFDKQCFFLQYVYLNCLGVLARPFHLHFRGKVVFLIATLYRQVLMYTYSLCACRNLVQFVSACVWV